MVWTPADLLWSLTNRAGLTAFESVCANLFLLLVASLGVSPAHNLIRGSQFNPKGKVLATSRDNERAGQLAEVPRGREANTRI